MVTGIITIAVQLLGWFLERQKVKAELAREFFQWAEKLGSDLGSARLRDYGFKQIKWFTENPWQETK